MRDDVIDEAERLGARIASHARTQALKDASAVVQDDPAARRLQEEYARAIDAVHRLESEGRPVEPEHKRKLASLGESIRRSEPLQRLLKAHADFAEMMDGVQRAISSAVDGELGGGEHEHEHGPGCSHGPEGDDEPDEPPPERSRIVLP